MTPLLQWAPLVLALVVIISGIGYLRWGRMQTAQATITLLKEQIGAQALKIVTQAAEIVEAKADNKLLVAKLEAQLAHMQIVENLVRGIPAWAELSANYATLQEHYTALERTIRALDPVIKVFQQHVDEQSEIYRWLKEWHEQQSRAEAMQPA